MKNYPQINQPGSEVFTASRSDVFQAIIDLITALRTDSSADASIVSVRQALDHISIQRVFYGNASTRWIRNRLF